MFNKRSLMKLVVVLLMMLLALQPIVHAGGSNSLVNGLLAAVATVVTGGGYLAAAVIGVAVGTQPSNPGGGTNTGRGGVQDYRVELSTFDGDQSEPASILIKLKDSVSGNYLIEGLPAGVSLYVRHSDPGTFLVEGYEPPSAASVDSSDNFIDVSACPRVSAVGIPSEIRYVVKSQSQSVRMDVINSSGSVVYSLTESSPSPAKPIPFVWKGTDIDGKGVSAGTYSVRLNAVKNDGAEESAPIQIMNIRNIINAGVEYEITSFSGGTATVRVWPPIDGSAATDIVTVSLWQGDRLISSANQTVNFAGGVLTEPTIAQNSLNFALTMTSNIDGVPVKITIPGADDSS
ncbi:MAG: FlgD immunoglobulin-like domain containing protein, partial [Candidatus Margulisiibacteriota bacterium]